MQHKAVSVWTVYGQLNCLWPAELFMTRPAKLFMTRPAELFMTSWTEHFLKLINVKMKRKVTKLEHGIIRYLNHYYSFRWSRFKSSPASVDISKVKLKLVYILLHFISHFFLAFSSIFIYFLYASISFYTLYGDVCLFRSHRFPQDSNCERSSPC